MFELNPSKHTINDKLNIAEKELFSEDIEVWEGFSNKDFAEMKIVGMLRTDLNSNKDGTEVVSYLVFDWNGKCVLCMGWEDFLFYVTPRVVFKN